MDDPRRRYQLVTIPGFGDLQFGPTVPDVDILRTVHLVLAETSPWPRQRWYDATADVVREGRPPTVTG